MRASSIIVAFIFSMAVRTGSSAGADDPTECGTT
jgi:hypothetical protein